MIVSRANLVTGADTSRFAWASLRSFQHVPTIASQIMQLHSIPKRHAQNARKQAAQLRYCLTQAREYRDAAALTSLATKPLLFYYSLMSLALAQILLKSTGADSLDAARQEHAHHGLVLRAQPVAKSKYDLVSAASALRAEPMITGDARRGTFELWQRTSREDPITGSHTTYTEGGSSTSNAYVQFSGQDERFGYLRPEGISLLEVLQATPGMYDWLVRNGIETKVVRAGITSSSQEGVGRMTLVVHPHRNIERVEQLRSQIRMQPAAVNYTEVFELRNSFILNIVHPANSSAFHIEVPSATTWNSEEVRFLDVNTGLNEFGLLYVAIYILGNYARYFPDRWMKDVEDGTALALATEELLSFLDERMALLTYSELSRVYWVCPA